MAALQLKSLSFLKNGPYNLDIPASHCCCLSGPSGIGKSKLFRCISDLDPFAGQILLDGTNSQEIPPSTWRKRVGYLPAESRWWYDVVGPHFDTYETSIFERLGFDEEIMTWPVQRLSTGERQRLAIIRLILNQPQVLLLDEPTAALDKDNVLRVEELILENKTKHQHIVLWVSHDPEQIQRVADSHYQLDKTQFTLMETSQ